MEPNTQETADAAVETEGNGTLEAVSTVAQLQAELAALKVKAKLSEKPAVAVKGAEAKTMTVGEAKAFVASFEGKKGRRPADFYAAQKIAGVSAEKPPKAVVKQPKAAAKVAKAAAKAVKLVQETKPMTVEEAKAFVASFEGKKGRRPAAFYEAQKLAGGVTGKTKKVKAVVKKAEKANCKFPDCTNKMIALGLCPSHYRQQSRGVKLKPLREVGRGLVRLPMVIRVEPETVKLLKQRIKQGKANSMYDASRQALEAGIAGWSKE